MKKAILGLTIGIITGMFSSGGGVILVPMLVYFLYMDEKDARSLSIFCMLPIILTSFFIYNKNSYINWNLGLKCAVGGIIGGIIGAKLLRKLTTKWIKIIFVVFLFYVSIRMLIS